RRQQNRYRNQTHTGISYDQETHVMRLILCLSLAVAAAAASAQTIAPLQPVPGSNRVTYFIAQGEPDSEFRASDVDLATWALRTWETALDGALKFEPSSEGDAMVQVHWVG